MRVAIPLVLSLVLPVVTSVAHGLTVTAAAELAPSSSPIQVRLDGASSNLVTEADLTDIGIRPEVISQPPVTWTPTAPPQPSSTANPRTITTTPPATATPRHTRRATPTPLTHETPHATITPAPTITVDPAAPTATFHRQAQLGGQSRAAGLLGDHVLLGLGSRVEVLDVSDGAMPTKVAHYTVRSIVAAVAVDPLRDLAFVLDTRALLHIVDFAQPSYPDLLYMLALPSEHVGAPNRMINYRDRLYLPADGGFAIIDVADPTSPTWLGTVSAEQTANDLTVSDAKLHVVSHKALQIFDVTEPDRPGLLGTAAVLPDLGERVGAAVSVAVVGDTAYVSAYGHGEWFDAAPRNAPLGKLENEPDAPIDTECFVLAFDVSDPESPVEARRLDLTHTMEFPGSLAATNGQLYMEASQYAGPSVTYGVVGVLFAFDITDPHKPAYLGQFDRHADVGSDLVAHGDRLYVPEWHGGLRSLSFSQTVTPTLLSSYDVPFVPRAIAAHSGVAAVGDHGIGGLWSVTARDPDPPGLSRHVTLGRGVCGASCELVVRDDLAYLADQNDGLIILDVSDPATPLVSSRLLEVGHAYAIDVHEGHAYIGTSNQRSTWEHELIVVDIRDPYAPSIVGRSSVAGEISDLAHSDGMVFTATRAGMSVVDVSQPQHPVLAGSLAVGGYASSIAANGSTAFLVEVNGTFHVIDASDPTRPRQIGWLDKARDDDIRPNAAYEMVVTYATAYVMHLGWLQAVDIQDPTAPRELGWTSAFSIGAEQGFIDLAIDAAASHLPHENSAIAHDVLYIASDENGVFIVEAHVPADPMTRPCDDCSVWLPAVYNRHDVGSSYLFIEQWWNDTRGPGCPPLYVDFPTYHFDTDTGALLVWSSRNPRLASTDIGFYGSGSSVYGAGSGTGSGIARIEAIPYQTDNIAIHHVGADGDIEVVVMGERLHLRAGDEKRWRSVRTAEPPGCVITETRRVTNYGLRDRDKIQYTDTD